MPGPKEQPAEELTGKTIGRFLVGARLGAGGMGEVYRATDTKLKRVVALKRLAPKLRADADYHRRFLKEAERVAHLTHQRIAALYDVLEEQGELFLVMEYVEGQTLRQRLSAEITLDECLEIAVQCAEGLSAAHEQGVLHLDIKPENFMLSSSGPLQVKILDFGVARRLPQADAGTATATGSGAAIEESLSGTVVYMAPEVLLKKKAGERADIFSLGVVFFECLTGRHPFLTVSVIATAGRILHEAAPPVRQWNPRVPAEMERIVAKMLAKDPAERYATTRDLLVDLRAVQRGSGGRLPVAELFRPRRTSFRIWAAILAVLLVMAFPWLWQRFKPFAPASGLPSEKHVAVLPFSVVSGDPQTAAFSSGLTETVTSKLTQLTRRQSLQVTPSSVLRDRKIADVEKAGVELGINLAITGSLQQSGDALRVSVNLVDVRRQVQLRAESFDAAFRDPFALQDRVVDVVVRMLEIEPAAGERQALAERGTAVAGAEDQYLQGRGYLRNYDRAENIDLAITAFQQALALDPRYAQAHAGLGSAFWQKKLDTRDSRWADKALDSCRQAVSLNDRQAPGHVCLGTVYSGTGRYEEAVAEFSRASALEPTNDDVFRGLGRAYERLGKFDQAERTYQEAINLRPHYWAGHSVLAGFYYRRQRLDEAAQKFEQVVRLIPDSYQAHYNLGAVLIVQGKYDRAIPVLQHSLSIHPTPAAYSNLATAQFYLRRFSDSVRNYQEAIRLGDNAYVIWGNLGDAYFYRGQAWQAKAKESYRQAVALASEELKVNPRDPGVPASLAVYHARMGEKTQAVERIQQALKLGEKDPETLFKSALVYNQLGQTGAALDWLEKAIAAGHGRAVLRDSPEFDNLREQARFQALTR